MRKWKKVMILLTVSYMTFCVSGCAKSVEESTEEIVLLDPANIAAEKAAVRDLYDYMTYSGVIYPYVEEYSFSSDVEFGNYEVFPGQTAAVGDILAYADNSSKQKQIKELNEQLEILLSTYTNDIEYIQSRLNEKRATTAIQNTVYNIEVEIMYMEMRYLDEQYELDYAYYQNKISELQNNVSQAAITAQMAGTVARIGSFWYGDGIAKETSVAAIADDSQKIFRCEFIDSKKISNAKAIYLLINGKQYTVTNVPYDVEEYDRLVQKEETLYSTFTIEDPENEVSIGDFAVLAIYTDYAKQVLSVPKTAISKDETGYYVYVERGGETVRTYVDTGFSDGVYTEIVSGLSEGDRISLTVYKNYGSSIATVERGEFYYSFDGSGSMTYPDSYVVLNSVQYGTTHLVENKVRQYSKVNVGDVIATINVVSDDILLCEKELELQRLKERLGNLQYNLSANLYTFSEYEKKAINRQIEEKQKLIEKLEVLIMEITSNFRVTEIKAERSGIVFWINDKTASAVIDYEERIAVIADESACYIVINNENQQLNYGDTVEVEYTDSVGTKCVTRGDVVTVTANALSSGWDSAAAYVLLPSEAVAEMSFTREAVNSDDYTKVTFKVTTQARMMSDVLILPKNAVQNINGQTYVNVMDANGNIYARSFIAGGYNTSYYWVLDGLREGMTICLD